MRGHGEGPLSSLPPLPMILVIPRHLVSSNIIALWHWDDDDRVLAFLVQLVDLSIVVVVSLFDLFQRIFTPFDARV